MINIALEDKMHSQKAELANGKHGMKREGTTRRKSENTALLQQQQQRLYHDLISSRSKFFLILL